MKCKWKKQLIRKACNYFCNLVFYVAISYDYEDVIANPKLIGQQETQASIPSDQIILGHYHWNEAH